MVSHSIKTFLKNGYLFLLNLWSFKKGFFVDLIKLFDKWPSPYREKSLTLKCAWKYKDSKDVRLENSKSLSNKKKFINSLKKKNKDLEFYKDINDFLKKHNLGYEWFRAIIDVVVNLWLYPPSYNL